MKIFSLSKFLNFVKQAMGAQALRHKKWDEEYVLWNVDDDIDDIEKVKIPQQVSEQHFDTWRQEFYNNAALPLLTTEAKNDKLSIVNEVMDFYGLPRNDANQICKVFVAYKPSDEGYIVSIAPYLSRGFWHGAEHVVGEAGYGFYLGTHARLPMTPTRVLSATNRRVNIFNKTFENKLNITPDDLKLSIRAVNDLTKEKDLDKKRKAIGDEIAQIPSLDPNNPNYESFFQDWIEDPTKVMLAFKSIQIGLNPRGIDKYLRGYVNPWYEKALMSPFKGKNKIIDPNVYAKDYYGAQQRAEIIRAKALKENKVYSEEEYNALLQQQKEELRQEALQNEELMRKIYLSTNKWLREDSESQNPDIANKAKINIPYAYSILDQRKDEIRMGVPQNLLGKEYNPNYVKYSIGQLPNYSDFFNTYGGQEATGVSHSIKQKEGSIALYNEIEKLKINPVSKKERSPQEIANLLNRGKVSRSLSGVFTDEIVSDIMNKIKVNPTVLTTGGAEYQAEEAGDSGSQEEIKSSYHMTLESALHEARRTFSTSKSDPVTGASISSPSQRAIDIFSSTCTYKSSQLKTARIKAVIAKLKNGVQSSAFRKDFDFEMVSAISERVKENISDDDIVLEFMNGKVVDTSVQPKKEAKTIEEAKEIEQEALDPNVLPVAEQEKEPTGLDFPIDEKTDEKTDDFPIYDKTEDLPMEVQDKLEKEKKIPPIQKIPLVKKLPKDVNVPEPKEELKPEETRKREKEKISSNNDRKIIIATLKSLIDIAEDLDNDGKDQAAEEVHNLIRKYQGRI